MGSLADLVAAQVARHPEAAVESVIFGSRDAERIAREIEAWCAHRLGATVADAWLWTVSVGCVCGVSLTDGRDVVVKTYAPDRSAARITSVLHAQRHAVARGMPGAVPLSGPHPLGHGHAVAESALSVGRRPVLVREPDRSTAAAAWSALGSAFRGAEHLVGRPRDGKGEPDRRLYPTPHSPLFDFDATVDGAEWIDDLARSARAAMDALDAPEVVSHADWRGDNLRVSDDGKNVVAVFDWDSLRLGREVLELGQVAAMHSVDWPGPDDPYFATAAECIEFVEAVERVRPRAFTAEEWRVAKASIVYGWCYTARCEHARAAVGADDARFKMRARLREDGPALLR